MAEKVTKRAVVDGTTDTGLAEFQSSEFIALTYGGLGVSLSLGSAGQVLKVNDAGNAWELGNASSAEVYGFVKNGNNLNVTTTNGGQDNITNTVYAAFDDKVFADKKMRSNLHLNSKLLGP